jgi:hypothetical protein
LVLEGFMTVVKGVLFVALVVAVTVAVFNGLVVAASAYFGPFYENDADQSRNFGIWLLGNGVVVGVSMLVGVVWFRRRLLRG